MKMVIFTSNALRHKYIANIVSQSAGETLVVSECVPQDTGLKESVPTTIQEHFVLRAKTEEGFFGEHQAFQSPTFPILYKEVNLPFVYRAVEKYKPDAAFVFGSSIIKEPLLSLIPKGRFINLHLGLSPYYRGSGTNFWPLVNNEPEYVGATLLHIDAGIDTGDIVAHVRPEIVADDTAHTVGCKTIIESGKAFLKILSILKEGGVLPRVRQWAYPDEKVYKKRDFNEEALIKYHKNLKHGMMNNYVNSAERSIKLISL